MDKLDAINVMLSHIAQAPISSLEGHKTARIAMAEDILEQESASVQMLGWFFNSESDYPLHPDENGEIYLPKNTLRVSLPYESDEYVQHGLKLYNKTRHTYKIGRTLKADIVKQLDFDALPPIAKSYIVKMAANKFVAKVKGSKEMYAFSQAEVAEAKLALEEAEANTGNYSALGEYRYRLKRSI